MLATVSDTPRSLPASLEELDPAEHLLIWGLRAMAVGHGDCPVLAQTFDRLCGPQGQAALQAHFVLVRLVGMGSRRQMRVHAPGCLGVGVDEAAVVGLVAAAQQALEHGDDGLLRLRLGFLTRRESGETVRCAAMALAQVLTTCGRRLPVRMEPGVAHEDGADRPRAALH